MSLARGPQLFLGRPCIGFYQIHDFLGLSLYDEINISEVSRLRTCD